MVNRLAGQRLEKQKGHQAQNQRVAQEQDNHQAHLPRAKDKRARWRERRSLRSGVAQLFESSESCMCSIIT